MTRWPDPISVICLIIAIAGFAAALALAGAPYHG
jgi:hypothetical protein